MLLDGLALATRLPQNFANGARQLGRLDQGQGQAEEQVARGVVEEAFGTAAFHVRGVQHLRDGQRVADDMTIGRADRTQRVPAVRAAVFGERCPRIDRLAVRRPKPCRDRPVLRLDVDDHGAVLPGQQVGHHHAHTLAAAGGCAEHHRLLARQGEEAIAVLADDDPLSAQQPGVADLGGIGKTRRAVQLAAFLGGRCNAHRHQQQQHKGRHHQGHLEFSAFLEIA